MEMEISYPKLKAMYDAKCLKYESIKKKNSELNMRINYQEQVINSLIRKKKQLEADLKVALKRIDDENGK